MVKQLLSKKSDHNKILLCIIVVAAILRLYRIDNPIADWHAFRQADTASVTREYTKAEQINLLEPHYHDLSNIQSGLDNPEGYRMVEFPFINALIAAFLRLFPQLDLVLVSRLASVLVSLGTILVLYRFIALVSGKTIALLAAFFYAVLPYGIYYSRVVLPEPYMLFFSTLSLWQFFVFTQKKTCTSFLISSIALAFAALLKPFVVFLAPVYLTIMIINRHYVDWRILFFPVIAFAPVYWWREWIGHFPSGVPAADWLLNGNGIRLRPAWFRWLFYERMTKLILGFAGVVLLLGNLRRSKDLLLYASWWLACVLYLVIFATGNVQHDYYQNLLLPLIAASLARGSYYGYQLLKSRTHARTACFAFASLVVISLFLSWREVAGFFNVNHWEYIKAGAAVDRLVPKNAQVIAPAMGDTQFLFQTNRRGWPIGFEIPDKINKGATIYVSTSYDYEAKALEEQFQVLEKTPEYIIIDLSQAKL